MERPKVEGHMDPALGRIIEVSTYPAQLHELLVKLQIRSVGILRAFKGPPEEFIELLSATAQAADLKTEGQGIGNDRSLVESLARLSPEVTICLDMGRASGVEIEKLATADILHGLFRNRGTSSGGSDSNRTTGMESLPKKLRRDEAKVAEFNVNLLNETSPKKGQALSLRGAEIEVKKKWIQELLAIIQRSDGQAKIITETTEKYGTRASEIINAMLGRGALSTIEGHVGRWWAIEKWFKSLPKDEKADLTMYPPSPQILGKYLIFRSQDCGPSVPDSVRSTFTWIGMRIGMEIPDTSSTDVMAIRDMIVEKAGRAARKAIPFGVDLICAMELYWSQLPRTPALLVWWALTLIAASLRFDDAVHVEPKSLLLTSMALFGISWQTKVHRGRTGVKFAALNGSISGSPWLKEGFEYFKESCPGLRDWWFPYVSVSGGSKFHMDLSKPIEYGPGLVALKCALKLITSIDKKFNTSWEEISGITWHSCKVTVLAMAAHAGVSGLPLELQAHWSPGSSMPTVYARDTMKIPLEMVSGLWKRLKKGWKPGTIEIDEKEQEADTDEIYRKMVQQTLKLKAVEITEDKIDELLDPNNQTEQHEDALQLALQDEPMDVRDNGIVDSDSDDEFRVTFYSFATADGSCTKESLAKKFHVPSITDPSIIACNLFGKKIVDLTPEGPGVPPRPLICDRCAKKRPQILLLSGVHKTDDSS